MGSILIIDDQKDVCESISAIASRLGHEVSCAYTQSTGFHAAREGDFERLARAAIDGLPQLDPRTLGGIRIVTRDRGAFFVGDVLVDEVIVPTPPGLMILVRIYQQKHPVMPGVRCERFAGLCVEAQLVAVDRNLAGHDVVAA